MTERSLKWDVVNCVFRTEEFYGIYLKAIFEHVVKMS